MSHHLRRPHRRRSLVRLLSRAARRLLPTRQPGQTCGRATATASPRHEPAEKESAGKESATVELGPRPKATPAYLRKVSAVPRSPAGRLSWVGCDERSADRGAATVWLVGGIAVLMVVTMAVCWFCGAVVARHTAEGAADLGALAAAVTAADGEEAACAEARWVVERMGAVLLSCRLSGWDALVEADVAYLGFGSAAGRARAGPVELNR